MKSLSFCLALALSFPAVAQQTKSTRQPAPAPRPVRSEYPIIHCFGPGDGPMPIQPCLPLPLPLNAARGSSPAR